jgi:hypothetical protein
MSKNKMKGCRPEGCIKDSKNMRMEEMTGVREKWGNFGGRPGVRTAYTAICGWREAAVNSNYANL